MDVRLLVEVASELVLHRLPCSRAEAEAVLRECLNVLRLWSLMQTRPLDQVGSETKTKQILAEYLRRRYEQHTADGKCVSHLREQ
jgi:hypothetical protein